MDVAEGDVGNDSSSMTSSISRVTEGILAKRFTSSDLVRHPRVLSTPFALNWRTRSRTRSLTNWLLEATDKFNLYAIYTSQILNTKVGMFRLQEPAYFGLEINGWNALKCSGHSSAKKYMLCHHMCIHF